MGYPLDTAAQNAGLQAWFGVVDRTPTLPASWEVALFTDHPLLGGTELTSAGGYARLVVANTSANFPAAVAGLITSAQLLWPDPTAAYSDTARFFVLYDHADSITRWYVGVLGGEIDVNGAQPGFATTLSIHFNTEGA